MNRRLTPTTQLRWVDRHITYLSGYEYIHADIEVLEQWHQNEVLTENQGWQPVEGGEWREVRKEKTNE